MGDYWPGSVPKRHSGYISQILKKIELASEAPHRAKNITIKRSLRHGLELTTAVHFMSYELKANFL